MHKNSTKAFLIVCLTLIAIPFVFTILKIKVKPVDVMEKQISLNFQRNFPLKSDLFKIFSFLKADVFHTNPIEDRVIDMHNGWKFLGNEFSNALSESKALLTFSNEELITLKKVLTDRREWLKERNIKFYLAVAPNKHSVYGDMIPIVRRDRNSKMQQIDSLCKTLDISYIDLGMDFPEDKPMRLYHKTDSHWNDYAGFYALKTTMKFIERDFKNNVFHKYAIDSFNIKVENFPIGDLNEMLMEKKSEDFILFSLKNPTNTTSLEKRLPLPKDYNKDPAFYETRFQSDINDLKIFVLNDSYFGYYSKFLKDNFGESVFIWNFIFDKKLIENEKPAIFYHEIVERDVDVLLLE